MIWTMLLLSCYLMTKSYSLKTLGSWRRRLSRFVNSDHNCRGGLDVVSSMADGLRTSSVRRISSP